MVAKKTAESKKVRKVDNAAIVYHPTEATYMNFVLGAATVSVWLHPKQVWQKVNETDGILKLKRGDVTISLVTSDLTQVFEEAKR